MATKAIVGEKVGMTQVWDDDNRVVPVTVLRVAPARDRAGQDHRARRLHRPPGHLRPPGRPQARPSPRPATSPRPASSRARNLVELRLDDVDGYEVGQEIKVDVLAEGRAGRRHRRQPGQGLRRRHEAPQLQRPGRQPRQPQACTGRPARSAPASFPGRVFKGTRMAGRMGGEQVTTLNLEVVEADAERDLLLVKGAVPGPRGRRRHRPQRREGRQAGEQVMATVAVKTAGRRRAAARSSWPTTLFGIEPNVPVMHQVVTAQLAARRAGTQSTKTRAEVRGGGAQAVPQKGTGSARQGSTRAPALDAVVASPSGPSPAATASARPRR